MTDKELLAIPLQVKDAMAEMSLVYAKEIAALKGENDWLKKENSRLQLECIGLEAIAWGDE